MRKDHLSTATPRPRISPEASYYHAATTAATTPLAPGLWGGGGEAEGATMLMSELGGDSYTRESRRACMEQPGAVVAHLVVELNRV